MNSFRYLRQPLRGETLHALSRSHTELVAGPNACGLRVEMGWFPLMHEQNLRIWQFTWLLIIILY